MPIDIKDVKAGIQAGRLFVQLKDDHILLGDYQTGEAVRISDIAVRPVAYAKWNRKHACTRCSHTVHVEGKKGSLWLESPFCPNCGARMDGDPHDERGQ